MFRRLTLVLVTPLAAVALLRPPAEAAERVIRVPADAATLSEALEKAAAGDVIEASDGVRSGALRIRRPVVLRAAAGATVVVRASKEERCIDVDGVRDGRVAIEGLRLEGGRTGVRAVGCADVVVRGCQVAGCWAYGIAASASTIVVEDCHVVAPPPEGESLGSSGVGLDAGSRGTLRRNRVDGAPSFGVWVDQGSRAAMEGNDVRGARVTGRRGGVGIVIRRSSSATLSGDHVEGNEAGGVEVVAADAALATCVLVGNGNASVSASRGANVSVTGGSITSTAAGPVRDGGDGVLCGDHARVTLAGVEISAAAAAGVRAGLRARVDCLHCSIRGCARGGIFAEGGALCDVREGRLEGNSRHGAIAIDGAVLSLDGVRISGTRAVGSVGRGVEASGHATARLSRCTIEGCEDAGVVVLDRSLADVADTAISGNGRLGVTVERRSRARVRRCTIEGHTEVAVTSRERSEIALFDSVVKASKGLPLVVPDATMTGGGNRFEGGGAGGGERLKRPCLTLRLDGEDPLPGAVVARLAGADGTPSPEPLRLAAANAPVDAAPGRYRLFVSAPGTTRAVPWGEVDVTDGEEVVRLDMGIALDAPSPPARWRVRRADGGDLVQDASGAVAAVAVPAGRYRVSVVGRDGTERPVEAEGPVVVEAGRVARVAASASCCARPALEGPISVSIPRASSAPLSPLVVRVDVAPSAPDDVRARLYAIDPRGRVVGLEPTGAGADPRRLRPLADVAGDRALALPADAAAGDYLVVAEAVHEGDAEPVVVAQAHVLRAGKPVLRLAVPRDVGPGERLEIDAAVAGASAVRADLFVSVVSTVAPEKRFWIVPGGRDAVAVVEDRRRAPLLRAAAVGDGHHVLYRGTMPSAVAGLGELRVEASLVDPATGAPLATHSIATRSIAGRVPLAGVVHVDGRPRPPAPGERAVVTAVRHRAGRARPLGRTAVVGADASFSFGDVPPGEYTLTATLADAHGRVQHGAPMRLDVGAGGVANAAPSLGAAPGAAPSPATSAPAGPPSSTPAPSGPLPTPSAGAGGTPDPATGRPSGRPAEPGGCGGPPGADPCPCGRMPVCVYAGDRFLLGDPTAKNVHSWATWWLPRRYELGIAAGFEKRVAQEMERLDPCIEAIPMEATLIERFTRMIERVDSLRDELKAVLEAEDPEKALAEHPEVARVFSDVIIEVMGLIDEPDYCVGRVVLDGKPGLNSFRVDYRTDSPELPDELSSPSEPITDLEFGRERDPTRPPPDLPPPVAPATGTGSVSGRDFEALAEDLARQATPDLLRMRKALFCACEEVVSHCVVEKWATHIRGPGVFTVNRCTYTTSCCGRQVRKWDVLRIVPGTSGLAGGARTERTRCCGRWDEEFPRGGSGESDDVFCSQSRRRKVLDIDCDGLPNTEDPTPLGEGDEQGAAKSAGGAEDDAPAGAPSALGR